MPNAWDTACARLLALHRPRQPHRLNAVARRHRSFSHARCCGGLPKLCEHSVGVGAAIGPGAMATMSCGQCGVFHFGLGRTRTGSNEYYVNLAYHIIAFVLPWVILMLPFLALFMQVTT